MRFPRDLLSLLDLWLTFLLGNVIHCYMYQIPDCLCRTISPPPHPNMWGRDSIVADNLLPSLPSQFRDGPCGHDRPTVEREFFGSRIFLGTLTESRSRINSSASLSLFPFVWRHRLAPRSSVLRTRRRSPRSRSWFQGLYPRFPCFITAVSFLDRRAYFCCFCGRPCFMVFSVLAFEFIFSV